jgi:hypothetical protein
MFQQTVLVTFHRISSELTDVYSIPILLLYTCYCSLASVACIVYTPCTHSFLNPCALVYCCCWIKLYPNQEKCSEHPIGIAHRRSGISSILHARAVCFRFQ